MIFYIFYLFILLLVSMTSYMVTNNVMYCIIIASVFLAYFIIFDIIIKRKQKILLRKNNDLYKFIHDFLSVYNCEYNIDKSLLFAEAGVSNYLKEELKILEDYKAIDKLSNLTNYFSNNIYDLFLNVVKDNKIDNKREMIEFVKNENDFFLNANIKASKEIKNVLIEFLLLWVVSSFILVSMRFAIHNYFEKISSSIYFIIGVSLFYAVFVLSIHLLVRGYIKKYE